MAKTWSQDWGRRLRRERERRGWTRKYLAEQIDAGAHSIYRWEDGRDKPHPDMRERLIKTFGKPEEDWGRWIGNVPFLPNLYFTGREHILARLHTALNHRTIMVVSQRRTISGLGGIGKTQTAVEYAYRYGDDYDLVLWVRADSHEMLLSQFAGLASLLNLPIHPAIDQRRQAEDVRRHLETHEVRVWLLIFDNVEDMQAVKEFLPKHGNGAILLTTRLQAVGNHMHKIEMDTLSLEESMQFLMKKKLASDDHEQTPFPETERQAAEQLCRVLDRLPLALDQAAAYIEEHNCSFSEYTELYQQQRASLLQQRNQIDLEDYPNSVATTWLLSFQQVEQTNPDAIHLLHLIAFLHPDAIPEEALLQGVAELELPFQEAVENGPRLQAAIEILQKYSLIQRNQNTRMITIHRLVQAVIQDMLEAEQAQQWIERAVRLVNCAFPDGEFTTWDRCEQLIHHVLVCADHIKMWKLISVEAGHLFYHAGEYFALRAQYEEALTLTQQALEIRKQALGTLHPDVASSLNNVGYIYYEMGRYEDGLPAYQMSLSIREQLFEPTHPDITESLNNLAEIYREQGKYEEALPLFKRALSIREQTQGPNDPHVADYLNNLALLYQDQEDYEQARQCFQRALTILEQTLDPNDPRLAVSLNNLGGVLRAQGAYVEARRCFEQAQAISELALGPDNFYVAHSLYNLAELAQAEEKDMEALALFQRALVMMEQSLGASHPSIATRLHNLANLHLARERSTEALPLFERALIIREQALGLQHPKTRETRQQLITLLKLLGQYKEATRLEAVQA